MSKESVGKLVRHYLEGQHPEGITIAVLDDAIRRQDDYWYVPVQPDRQPPKMYAYYEALAEVEGELEENDSLNVLLVPTVPE
ncbi:MAG: hypothetical protein M3Y28_04630 [Armatimonadota bacterium]|nr:hypothetical protein [Armatimonadota bacterium]